MAKVLKDCVRQRQLKAGKVEFTHTIVSVIICVLWRSMIGLDGGTTLVDAQHIPMTMIASTTDSVTISAETARAEAATAENGNNNKMKKTLPVVFVGFAFVAMVLGAIVVVESRRRRKVNINLSKSDAMTIDGLTIDMDHMWDATVEDAYCAESWDPVPRKGVVKPWDFTRTGSSDSVESYVTAYLEVQHSRSPSHSPYSYVTTGDSPTTQVDCRQIVHLMDLDTSSTNTDDIPTCSSLLDQEKDQDTNTLVQNMSPKSDHSSTSGGSDDLQHASIDADATRALQVGG